MKLRYTFLLIGFLHLQGIIPQTANQFAVDSIYGISKVNDEYPSWSPDGSMIAFQSNRLDDNYEIYLMNADGKNIRRLTFNSFEDETPIWSPDGKNILFSRYTEGDNNELFLINTDGSNERQLTDHPLRDGHAKFLYDGSKIIFNSQRDDDGSLALKNYELYEMNRAGEEIKRLTIHGEWDTYPSFSPDGKRILWRRILADTTAPRGYNSEIFAMGSDLSNPINLSRHPAFDGYPEWSPDGQQILFVSSRNGQTTSHLQLFLMQADGSNIRQLTYNRVGEEDVRPAWSPDGRKIAFNRDNADGSRIYIIEVGAAVQSFNFNPVYESNTVLARNSSRGVAWGDYNNDGLPDLLVANTMNNSNTLYKNAADNKFRQQTEGPAVTSGGWTEGASWVDYDNDNDLDIFYTNQFGAPNQLFRNDMDKGFVAVKAGDLTQGKLSATSSCWCDYDLDGDLDVYVVQRDGKNDILYSNLGNGTFSKVAETNFPYKGGDGRSCAWGDTNGDLYPELYVGNFLDKTTAVTTKARNFYYMNMGDGSFRFQNNALITQGTGLTYGVSFVDYDQDNDLDLFVTNIAKTDHNLLFANDGNGNFSETTTAISTAEARSSKGHTWGDFDNDGDLDLFIVNGTEGVAAEETNNYIFRNDGANEFELLTNGAISNTPSLSAGTATADFDRDGDLDIYVANWGQNSEPNMLYKNDLYGTNWIEIALKGINENSQGIGSKVRLEVVRNGQKKFLIRWLLPNTGYASQNEPILHFGLGNATEISSIEITWPSGKVQRLEEVPANQYLEILEVVR